MVTTSRAWRRERAVSGRIEAAPVLTTRNYHKEKERVRFQKEEAF